MAESNGNGARLRWNIFWISVISLLWGSLGASVGLLHRTVSSLETRVTVIESNRFTTKDGQALVDELERKLPPKWLVDMVARNSESIERIKERIYKITP